MNVFTKSDIPLDVNDATTGGYSPQPDWNICFLAPEIHAARSMFLFLQLQIRV
jgi:hypothetical protein